MGPTNAQLAELLRTAAAEEPSAHRRVALERASRSAMFRWPEEAAAVAEAGRSLTELPSVGPWVARKLLRWLEGRPGPPEPPPLRRGFLTLAEARATVAGHPEWAGAVRGDLQVHTTYSDGRASLPEVVRRCLELGRYEYVLITDHSRGLRVARGMDPATLLAEGAEIDLLNRELDGAGEGLRVLRGIEMNLSPEGEGDVDPAVLRGLDLVLGAFHSRLRVEEDQTGRYLRALANPAFHVLAHPRGRRFDVRAGLRADWARVAEEAASRGKALEVDGFPDRQDLDVELVRLAAASGTWISLGTDAHHPDELRFMDLALAIAIRAGFPRDRVLNFLPREDLLAWADR